MSFRATPCHSEAQRGTPPFAQRKGPGECPHVILAKARIQRGRDGKIMAIIQKSWQSWFKTSPLRIHTMSFRAQRGISNVILAKARIQRGRDGKIMAIFPPSWQSWFKTRHSRAGGNPQGTGRENHGNHSHIMAIMVQNLPQSPAKSGRISLIIMSCASLSIPV